MYEILLQDSIYIYVKVIEDCYHFHYEKVCVDDFERWKAGKIEI